MDFYIEAVDTDTGKTVYIDATTDPAPTTAHHYDPAAWNTATCQHCDGQIIRRISTLEPSEGITDGRWRHTRSGKTACTPEWRDNAPHATPRKHPEQQDD